MTNPPSRGLSRRRLLAGGAALIAAPAVLTGGDVLAQNAGDVDVAIIGGGAAGIAAARAVAASGRSHLLLEASDGLGGRARTDTAFGLPVDLGAASFSASSNLAASARAAGLPVVALPPGDRLVIAGHGAAESRYDAASLALGRDRRDILAAADAGRDVAVAGVLTQTGPWSALAAAQISRLSVGREPEALSTLDLALRDTTPDDLTSPLGVGALLEALSAGLNRQTHAQVNLITNGGRFHTIGIAGQRATLRARAIVLAIPAPVLAAGVIRFNPSLPPRLVSALRAFPAGALEQVAFLLPGNPLDLGVDERVLAVRTDTQAPAARLRARVQGSDLHVLTFGGAPAREIADKGAPAALALARSYLDAAFGGSVGAGVSDVVASRWSADPLIRGALVTATPGQAALRRAFGEPVQNRIFLAGEYTSLDDWGTLNGAFASGEIAAAKALRVLGEGPA